MGKKTEYHGQLRAKQAGKRSFNLTEKQFKKWIKYQEGKLKELKPKNTQQSMQSRQNKQQIQRNRQIQGMNRRRY